MGIFYLGSMAVYLVVCVLPGTILAIHVIRSTANKDREFFVLAFLGVHLSIMLQTLIAYWSFIFQPSALANPWQIAIGHYLGLHTLLVTIAFVAVHAIFKHRAGAAIAAGVGLSSLVWFILGLSGVMPHILDLRVRSW